MYTQREYCKEKRLPAKTIIWYGTYLNSLLHNCTHTFHTSVFFLLQGNQMTLVFMEREYSSPEEPHLGIVHMVEVKSPFLCAFIGYLSYTSREIYVRRQTTTHADRQQHVGFTLFPNYCCHDFLSIDHRRASFQKLLFKPQMETGAPKLLVAVWWPQVI